MAALPADQTHREIRIRTYHYFQPSLVFYGRREVRQAFTEEDALQMLQGPHTTYLFLPADVWESMKSRVTTSVRLLARQRDLYDRCEIVVIEARWD
jgi:hypothetical protein